MNMKRANSYTKNPLVSVVLPVYNGAGTIRRAIDSILGQSFTDFRCIIINDGSTDNTLEILASYDDERINILNQENKGLVASLNRGILASRGKYIARMDADDIALSSRLERQVEFMERNPSVGVVGSLAKLIYSDGKERIRYRPIDSRAIRKNIIRINPFTHSSVMIRKEIFDKVNLYDTLKDGSKGILVEDYDLWIRILARGYGLANIPEVLMICYREPDSIMRKRSLKVKIKQQTLSRIYAIKELNLGFLSYFNLIPVLILSGLNHFGFKLDNFFRFLSMGKKNFSI